MIYKAKSLLPKLRLLTLAGQNDKGELEWIGTDSQWKWSDTEEMLIDHDYKNTFTAEIREIKVDWEAITNLIKDYKTNYVTISN